MAKLKEDYDIMIDQVRSIDNRRLRKKAGAIPGELEHLVRENLRIILDIY